MNAFRLLAATALLALSTAAAASPNDTGLGAPALAWDCARPGAPTYAKVRDTFGVHDFHRAHRASLHLREVVKRACAGGAERLLLVARPATHGEARLVASTVD